MDEIDEMNGVHSTLAAIRRGLTAVRRYAAGGSLSDLAAARFHVVAAVPGARRLGKRPYFGRPRFRVRWRHASSP